MRGCSSGSLDCLAQANRIQWLVGSLTTGVSGGNLRRQACGNSLSEGHFFGDLTGGLNGSFL
jgi:hypothetical protein